MLLLLFLLVVTDTVNGFCYYGTEFKNETGCFQFFRTPLNFTNAVRFCRVNLKSTIARPTSIIKNHQIQEAAYKLGIEEYWIGASNVDNDWEWLDGSLLQYSNFDVDGGYPMKTESQVGAVSMDSLSGLWYTKIDKIALPFVCEFQATDDYNQGIMYRAPKTQSLRFPTGGIKAPILMVQSTDQSSLYPIKGVLQNEQETGEKVYLFPPNITIPGDFGLSGPAIVIRARPPKRRKVKPVQITQTETELNRSLKEKEATEDSMNMKLKGSGGNSSATGISEEMSSNSKATREREENESLKTKVINIQRG